MTDERLGTGRKPGWRSSDHGKADFSVRLGAAELAAIDRAMEEVRSRGLSFVEVRRDLFDDPALAAFMRGVLERIQQGPGIVFLGGFPVDRYGEEELKAIYWGLSTHLGVACCQSTAGDYLGVVADRGNSNSRGYLSNRELLLHTDIAEIVGLLCVRPAREGGTSIFASSLAIRDIVEREAPQYLPILYRGFPHHRRGEEAPGVAPITPYDCPIFSEQEGLFSCFYSREFIDVAMRDLGRAYTSEEEAALRFIDTVAMRDGIRLEVQLDPGEAVFVSNYEVLHARTPFVDWDDPKRKRMLFRLWLEGVPPRPLRREVDVYQNASGRQGIDAQPGRAPGLPQYVVPTQPTPGVIPGQR